jgi:hypothetical protein
MVRIQVVIMPQRQVVR